MKTRTPSTAFGSVTAREGALTIEEREHLLREPIVASLATIDEDGYPYVVHVWTEWDGKYVWLLCRAKAGFVQHLIARPKVGLLVARPDVAQTRVLILGEAEVVAGPASLTEHEQMREVATRMAIHYRGEAGARYIGESLSWPRTLVRIKPRRYIGWGDIDWHPRYRP